MDHIADQDILTCPICMGIVQDVHDPHIYHVFQCIDCGCKFAMCTTDGRGLPETSTE